MKRIADFILKYPKPILAIYGILVVAAIYPAINIRTDFNLENFFPKEDPTIKDYEYLEQEFGRDDNIIMVGFKHDSLLSPAVLTDLQAIVDSAETIPLVTEVRSLWSAENIQGDGARLEFEPYLRNSNLQAAGSDSLKTELTTDSFVEGFLINDQATVTAFYLEIVDDKNNFDTRQQIIQKLNEILDQHRDKYDFKLSGIPYYRNQYVNYLNREITFYIILSSFLIIILLWVLYRSTLGVAFPMIIVWFTILFTLAIMQLTGGYFEVMSSTTAPILLCVGIADSIHMISKYDDARLAGLNKSQSITEMLQTLGSATFLTSITTAIGFGTLLTSNIVPMQRFGIYTAIGVMVAFIITITFLPSILTMSGSKKVFRDKSAPLFDFFTRTLQKVSRLNQHHYKKVVVGTLLFTLALGSGILLLKVNGKVFDELGRDTQPIKDAQFFSDNLTPPYPMEFVIDTGTENGIMDPEFLQQVESFTDYLEQYAEVDRVISINTLLKEVHHAMAPEQYSQQPLPQDEQLIAQYILLLEFNESDILPRFADFSYQRIRVATNVYDVGSYRINQIQDSLQTYLKNEFPANEVTLTGSTILSADLNGKIVNSLFKSILLAFGLISIIMAMLFKNVRMVLISLIPNILPLLMVAGFMGYTGIDIKASTAVIFTIAFGIAVDDSIHYLARVRVEMKRGRSLPEALEYTTVKTGKAIVVTSLILLAGFGSLLTSVFISTVYMGLLVGLTVFSALLCDLFLLPSLFYWIKPDVSFDSVLAPSGSKSIPEPVPEKD
ncbi:MMPL family transporter [Aliifodinibius sp. S!AR15-10]|uniref:efflux RND transporter permease subunit n=1 Tax=Aliifodinibius sp. S!AR15-10 TaxID=2950437 RepID=UPI0028583236|nr:MMPL family transporter [Aliifodinibius sp. S!AR15-10]MDR8392351.1 MMPL family transporter [Aliifodinibius sp. S!AR15-10]